MATATYTAAECAQRARKIAWWWEEFMSGCVYYLAVFGDVLVVSEICSGTAELFGVFASVVRVLSGVDVLVGAMVAGFEVCWGLPCSTPSFYSGASRWCIHADTHQPAQVAASTQLVSLNRVKVCINLALCLCTATIFWPTFIRFRESNWHNS